MESRCSSSKPKRPKFSLEEIRSATNYFSDAHIIGRGGFGKVYKGSIDEGKTTVAVKRRNRRSEQGRQEFEKEIETLTEIRHRNIVSLLGYCDEDGEMILVYDYVPNGTLEHHLELSRGGRSSLTWHQRINILIGLARGLLHLHECIPGSSSIINRDVKSSNILLDEKFEAKVSDFGLAKYIDYDKSHVITRVKGTDWYIDPYCDSSGGKLTRNSDTYAFGVVMWEVLSGKYPENLSDWDWRRKPRETVDPNVSGNMISEASLNICYDLAKACLNDDPKERPKMSHVLAQLESALDRLELVTSNPPPDIQAGSSQEDQNLQGELMTAKLNEKMAELATWQLPTKPANRPSMPSLVKGLKNLHKPQDFRAVFPTFEVDALQNKQTVDTDGERLDKEKVVYRLPIEISRADVLRMTSNFSRRCGGSVFRGVLKTGWDIAIKRIEKNLPDNEFIQQVSTIFSAKHENVVELLSYCLDGDLRFLVYEFAPRGSLHDILHGQRARDGSVLKRDPSWDKTVKIAIGVARGLRYLHIKKLMHLNITSRNVLLFDDENAKITNLHNLSTPCYCNTSHTDNRHSYGLISNSDYHPPECAKGDQTKKGDVYSFGVLLLELLTGRKVFDHEQGETQQNLVLWAKPQLGSAEIHEIVDARFNAEYPCEAVEKMAKLTKSCLRTKPDDRPSMRSVVRTLKNILKQQG